MTGIESKIEQLEQAELPEDTAKELAETYEETRRGRLYAWFDVHEAGDVELVETQYAMNTLRGPEADLTICVNSDAPKDIRQAFSVESNRRAKILRLENRY